MSAQILQFPTRVHGVAARRAFALLEAARLESAAGCMGNARALQAQAAHAMSELSPDEMAVWEGLLRGFVRRDPPLPPERRALLAKARAAIAQLPRRE